MRFLDLIRLLVVVVAIAVAASNMHLKIYNNKKTTNKNLVEKVTSYATCIWIDHHYWVASRIVARTSDFAEVRGRIGFKTRFVGHAPLYSFSMDICCMPYIFIYIYHHYIPFLAHRYIYVCYDVWCKMHYLLNDWRTDELTGYVPRWPRTTFITW